MGASMTGFKRFARPNKPTPLNAGVGWADKLWGTDKSGLLDKTAGLPVFSFSGNIPYTTLGTGWIGTGFEAINRWQFANDLTWVKGRHSIKVTVQVP
jgi:hypothetical protein